MRGARTGVQVPQDRRGRVHAGFQRCLVSVHIDDRPPRDAGFHARTGDSGRDPVDQARIERRRDDIVAPKGQFLAIGHGDFVRHILARQRGKGFGAGDLHLVVDGAGVDIQRATEQIRKAQHVVDLIGVIAAACGDDGVRADGVRLFGCNLWVWVRHGENHRVRGHAGDHVLRNGPLCADAKEHIGPMHRIGKAAGVGDHGMRRFPLVHAFGAALIDHTLGVGHDAVVMPRAHGFEQFQTGDPRRPCAVQHDLHILDLFARQMQRVQQARGTDHRGPVLVVVEHRNVHFFLEPLFDDETFGRFDVLKIDPAKGGAHQAHGIAEGVGVFGIEFDINRIDVGKAFEQNRFAFHHWLGRQRTQIAKAQHSRPVRDYGDQIALVGIIISGGRVGVDFLAGDRDAGGIGQRQVALRGHGDSRLNFPFARCRLHVELQRILAGQFVLGHVVPPLPAIHSGFRRTPATDTFRGFATRVRWIVCDQCLRGQDEHHSHTHDGPIPGDQGAASRCPAVLSHG